MISHVFYPITGGAQTHTLNLSRKLIEYGVEVSVVTRHYKGLARFENIDSIPVFRVGYGDMPKIMSGFSFIFSALRLIKKLQFDILHCHMVYSAMTTGVLARLLVSKRLIINPHGRIDRLIHTNPFIGRARLYTIRMGDAFVSISHDIHQELRQVGVKEALIWDIPNGVDTHLFRPVDKKTQIALRHDLKIPDNPLIIYVGRLSTVKGLGTLINSIPQVLQKVPDLTLLILGDGEERSTLEKHVEKLGVSKNIIFCGSKDNVIPYLQASDVFVLPSRSEAFPVALLEAMACGLPIVATKTSGASEILQDGVLGKLVPIDDVRSLAKGLTEVLVSPDLRSWGQRGCRHILNRYSLGATAESCIKMYESLMS